MARRGRERVFGIRATSIRAMAAASTPASFRDAPLGAGPESILPVVVMDSGLALRAPRNDGSQLNWLFSAQRVPITSFRLQGAVEAKASIRLLPQLRVRTAEVGGGGVLADLDDP